MLHLHSDGLPGRRNLRPAYASQGDGQAQLPCPSRLLRMAVGTRVVGQSGHVLLLFALACQFPSRVRFPVSSLHGSDQGSARPASRP